MLDRARDVCDLVDDPKDVPAHTPANAITPAAPAPVI